MKQLSKKLTLVVLMLLSAIFMFCGAASLGTMAVNADDSANSAPPTYTAGSETDDWYSLSYSRDHFTLLLDGNYRSYLDSGVADVKEFGGTLVSALREIIIGSILDVQKNSSGTSNVSRIVALADEGGYNPPEQLDKNFWENSQQLKDFRDYVLDRLSQPDEMQKYLDGEYDFLLEYAVGSYVESQGGTLSDAQKEKVETEIGEVLTEAKGHVDSYFDEQLKRDDLTTDEKAALTERKNQLNAQYAESVESTEQGGGSKLSQIVDKAVEAGGVPQITLKDIVTKFEGIYVDGKPLFTRTAVEGYEGGINLSALRYLATKIPRPSEIAQFTAEDFRTFFALKEVKIETTYGTIDFALTLGFKGETKAIRTAAEYLARYITVGVDGNAVSVQLLAPEAVTKALRKTVESTHFTDAQKNLVFSVFGKTADEIYDKATSYTVEDLLAFFKGVDYKYWFSNLTNAQFVQGFFGGYLTDVLGHPLTQTNIDNLIDRLHNFFAPKLDKLATMTVEEVETWLKDNVPGMNRVNVPAKVEAAAQKLLNLAKKVNWSNYDAKTIHELLADEDYDLNSKIYGYLERLENFDGLYETFLTYIEKVYKYIPESLKDGKIVNLYDGTKFAYEGEYTVDANRILAKLTSMAENRGYEQITDLLGYVKTLLAEKRTEYTVDLSLELTVPHLYKISYEVGGETVREGFLPAGVSGKTVATLSNLPAIEGYEVLGWMEKGTLYADETSFLATMPEDNVTLVPVTAFTLTETVDGAEKNTVNETYTAAEEYVLGVTVDGVSYAEGKYTYAWYKNGKEFSDLETLTLKNVADSGVYYVVVTDPATGYTVTFKEFKVTIEKQTVSVELEWTIDGKPYSGEPFIYNEKQHEVAVEITKINAIDDLTNAIFKSTALTEQDYDRKSVGFYTETLSLELTDEYVLNYELNADCAENIFEWAIMQLLITEFDAKLAPVTDGGVTDPDTDILTYIYTGKEIKVKWDITVKTNDPEAGWTFSDFFNEPDEIVQQYVGTYPEMFVMTLLQILSPESEGGLFKGERWQNNFWVDEDALDVASEIVGLWKIDPMELEVKFDWTYSHKGDTNPLDEAELSYDGEAYTVSATAKFTTEGFTGSVSDILEAVTYDENSVCTATNAGTYKATALLPKVQDTNYTVKLAETPNNEYKWEIGRATIDAPTNTWEGEFTFTEGDDKVHAVEGYTGANLDYFAVSYAYYDQSADPNHEKPLVKDALAKAGSYKVVATVTLKEGLTATNYNIGNTPAEQYMELEVVFEKDITVEAAQVVPEKKVDLTGVTIAFGSALVTYDGQPHAATLSGTDALSDDVKALLEISYSGSKLGTDAAPIHAGSYQASLNLQKLTDAGYQVENAPTPATLTIAKAAVTVTITVTVNDQPLGTDPLPFGTYTLAVAVVVKVGDTALTKDTDYTVTTEGLTGNAAGNYTAKVTVTLVNADDYTFQEDLDGYVNGAKVEKSYPWTIEAQQVTPPGPGDEDNYETGHKFTGDDGNVEVTLKSGTLPKDRDLSVGKQDISEYNDKIQELFKDRNLKAKIGVAYDIHFFDKDGNEVKADGCVFTVRIRIPSELMNYADDMLAVIHITDDGTVELVPGATRTGDNKEWMEFEANDFSIYAVVALDKISTSPFTADLWMLIALSLVALLLLIALIVLIVFAAKVKKPEETPGEETPAEELTEDESSEEDLLEEETSEETEETSYETAEGTEEETPVVYHEPASEEPAEETYAGEPVPMPGIVVEAEPLVLEPIAEEKMTVYDRSFSARLAQAEEPAKSLYNELKNYLLSYKFVRSRISWGYDSFTKGRNKICKLQFKGKSLFMYISLDPNTLDLKYHHKDVSDIARYADVPTKLKVRSRRALKYAKEMIDMLMQQLDIEQGEIENNNYTLSYKSTEELLKAGEIRVKEITAPDFWNMDANDVVENSELPTDIELPDLDMDDDE